MADSSDPDRSGELVDVSGSAEDGVPGAGRVDATLLVGGGPGGCDAERALIFEPADAVEFRAAWGVLERRWGQTLARAGGLDPGLLHERVDGQWSFIETLRHLVFATDAWLAHGPGPPQAVARP